MQCVYMRLPIYYYVVSWLHFACIQYAISWVGGGGYPVRDWRPHRSSISARTVHYTHTHTHIIVCTIYIQCNTVTILKHIIIVVMSSSHVQYARICIMLYISRGCDMRKFRRRWPVSITTGAPAVAVLPPVSVFGVLQEYNDIVMWCPYYYTGTIWHIIISIIILLLLLLCSAEYAYRRNKYTYYRHIILYRYAYIKRRRLLRSITVSPLLYASTLLYYYLSLLYTYSSSSGRTNATVQLVYTSNMLIRLTIIIAFGIHYYYYYYYYYIRV